VPVSTDAHYYPWTDGRTCGDEEEQEEEDGGRGGHATRGRHLSALLARFIGDAREPTALSAVAATWVCHSILSSKAKVVWIQDEAGGLYSRTERARERY
jgi:hypothetical protein